MKTIVKLIFVLVGFGLIECLYAANSPTIPTFPTKPTLPISSPVKETLDIRAIEARGRFHLQVKTGEKFDQIIASSDDLVLEGNVISPRILRMKIVDHTLYLSSNKEDLTVTVLVRDLSALKVKNLYTASVTSPKSTVLSVYADDVNALSLKGHFTIPKLVVEGYSRVSTEGTINMGLIESNSSGTLNLKGLHSQKVTVHNQGEGHIFLRGYSDVIDIYQEGVGAINAWNMSYAVNVQSTSTGTVQLIGKTRRLVVDLADMAFLNAYYLQAYDVIIKTYQSASAGVRPVHRLFAAAHGNSRINYTHKPFFLYTFPEENGQILHIHTHEDPIPAGKEMAGTKGQPTDLKQVPVIDPALFGYA